MFKISKQNIIYILTYESHLQACSHQFFNLIKNLFKSWFFRFLNILKGHLKFLNFFYYLKREAVNWCIQGEVIRGLYPQPKKNSRYVTGSVA